MKIHRISLNGFRNYEYQWADFDPGINVITGENAQGKTNLLEAVYLVSTGKSFRTRYDREMIGFGYSGAEVLADVSAGGRKQTVRILLRQGVRKSITVNGVKTSTGEIGGKVSLAAENKSLLKRDFVECFFAATQHHVPFFKSRKRNAEVDIRHLFVVHRHTALLHRTARFTARGGEFG